MKVFKFALIAGISLAVFLIATFFLIGFFKPRPGGILVDTSPASNIYIDGKFLGKTPFKSTQNPGTVSIKMVPDASDKPLLAYETKITLVSGVQTVVRREFGVTEEDSSGDVISFEKATGGEVSLIVISTPDNAQVSLDGVARGFAPYKTSTISAGDHQITVKAPGYQDRIMTVRTIKNYRLTVFAKLAKDGSQTTESPVVEKEATKKTYVEIQKTPTGFLRVRTAPGTAGEEIAEVKPGEKYQFLEEDTGTGWYKIQYQDPQPGLPNGITGWISNQFAKKLEETDSTPSATIN